MTAYLAGVTHRRCTEHPDAGRITGAMRGVLAVMSFPVKDARSECPDAERFICTLSWASIAKDSGYDRDYLRHDLVTDMVALGLIERVGEPRPRQPAHWRLTIHAAVERERLGVSDPQNEEQGWGAQIPKVGVSDPQAGGVGTPNPSDSTRPPGRVERGGSGAANALPSADAPGDAAAPSTNGSASRGVLGEIEAALGLSGAAAEAWAARKIAGSTATVRNETAFLRICLERELEQRAAPRRIPKTAATGKRRGAADAAPSAKKTKGGVSAAQRAAAQRVSARPYYRVRNHQHADALAASRAGEPHEKIAERLHVTVAAVDICREEANWDDASNALRNDQTPEQVAERFDLPLERVRRVREGQLRRNAVTAVDAGETPEQVAARLHMDPERVRGWHQEDERARARRRAMGVVA